MVTPSYKGFTYYVPDECLYVRKHTVVRFGGFPIKFVYATHLYGHTYVCTYVNNCVYMYIHTV